MPAALPIERPGTARRAAFQDFCGTISGGVVQSAWGDDWRENATSVALVEHYYAMHGLMLTSGVEATIKSRAPTAHEGHGGAGQPVDFVVNVKLEYFPESLYLPECGLLVNTSAPFIGPLKSVEVYWEPDEVLEKHGWFRNAYPASFTDAGGEAKLAYVPQEEESNGRGLEQKEPGTVAAAFNMNNALLALVQEPRNRRHVGHGVRGVDLRR